MFSRIRTAISRQLTPPRIFILSFAVVILIGAVLLRMPFAASGRHLSFVDALFSSASAVCVTGLAVIDIGKDLSLTGQIVTLILFQVGGLGYHHLLGRPVRVDGAGSLLQGTGDRPVHLSPHAASRFPRHRQGGPRLHLCRRGRGDDPPVHRFLPGFSAGRGLLPRPVQRRLGLQQLRLLALLGQPDVVPGGLARQSDRDGADRPGGDRFHRPARSDRAPQRISEEALAPYEDRPHDHRHS